MKHIPLRSEDGEAGTVEWSDAIRQIVRKPLDPQQGASIEEIRKGIRVFDALDKANGTLELEDGDWEHLCEKTKAMQWGFVDRRLATLVDDILGAQG